MDGGGFMVHTVHSSFTIDSSTSQNVSTIAPFRPPSHYQLSEKQMFQAYSIVISDALLAFSIIEFDLPHRL